MGCPRTSCGCRKKKLQADKFAGCTILNKMASHADSRRAYKRLLASGDYFAERTYYSEESGGFVVVHRGHMTGGLDSEMETARFYADRGVWVRLLDETGRGPFADAHHGGPRGDGLRWDYKTAQASGSPKSQVQSGISSGKKPSGNILIRFEEQMVNMDLLNRGVRAAFLHDQKRVKQGGQPLVRHLVLLFRTLTGYFEESRTPEEFFNEGLFRGPERND
jgi:hypothetical protein